MDALLCNTLRGTLSADRQMRDESEAQLYRLSDTNPELPITLLQYATSAAMNDGESVKLAAAIRLRNVVARADWNRIPYFTDSLKGTLRSMLVPLLCQVHVCETVRRQLLAIVEAVIGYDFPTAWVDLVPQLIQQLDEAKSLSFADPSDGVKLRCLLQVLRYVCKRYEDVLKCDEREIDEFASMFIPILASTYQRLITTLASASGAASSFHVAVAVPRETVEMYNCCRLALKCIWSIGATRWPLCLCDVGSAVAYAQLLQRTLEWVAGVLEGSEGLRPSALLSSGACDETLTAFNRSAAWRTVKWVLKHVHRLMVTMTTNPKESEKRARNAAKALSAESSVPWTAASFRLVQWHHECRPDGPFKPYLVTSKALVLAIEVLEQGAMHQASYTEVILPNAEALLTTLLFSRLAFTADDQELWSCNPVEYVRKLTDPKDDLFNPKLVSMGLIVTLCHAEKKFHAPQLLSSFVQYLFQHLAELLSALQAPGQPSAVVASVASRYDGCLYAISQMKKLLAHYQFEDSKIEWTLSNYVAPLLTCPVGYLRAKAVYVLALFIDTQWSSESVFPAILTAVLPLLYDSDLPVRIQTCVCLSKFVRQEAARDVVTPQIGPIVEQYFNIMRTMDNDGVVRTLRKTIKFYGETLSVWAVQLCNMLVQHFLVMHQELARKYKEVEAQQQGSGDNDDGDDDMVDSLMAADELMETLRTLIHSIPAGDAHRGAFVQMQEAVFPLLSLILSIRHGASLGFMDAALHLMTDMLARSGCVSASTWQLMPLLHEVVKCGSFLDYVEHLVPPIDNFVSVDPLGFITNEVATAATSLELTVDICNDILTNASSLLHVACVPKLVDAVLLNVWAKVAPSQRTSAISDAFLVQSITTLRTRALPPTLQTLFTDNILSSLICSPVTTLEFFVSNQIAEDVFRNIASLFVCSAVAPHLRRHDRLLTVAAVARATEILAQSNASVGECAASVVRLVLESNLLGAFAAKEAQLLRAEIQFHERRVKGEVDEDEDEEYDWDNSDDDDDTDSEGEFDEFDNDDEMDEDMDDDGNIGEDDAIANDVQYKAVANKARQLRELQEAQEEAGGEDDVNFLEDDDFESPLDEVNVWCVLMDHMSGAQAAGLLALEPYSAQAQAVGEAAALLEAVWEARKAKQPPSSGQPKQ